MFSLRIAVLSLSVLGLAQADDPERAARLRAEAAQYRQRADHPAAFAVKQPLAPGSRAHSLWMASKLEAEAARLDGPSRKYEVASSGCCSNCCTRTEERSQPCAD